MSRRLGWLGPAIVLLGAAIAALGIWYAIRSKPVAGAVIDTVAIDPHSSIVIRGEQGGPRAFVELQVDGAVKWQALVPPYAGRPGAPGVGWGAGAATIRVIREDHAEVFALALRDGTKLGGVTLASGRGPIARDAPGPVTLTDHIRSYELVAGDDWHELVAVDLAGGTRAWTRSLGAQPIEQATLEAGTLWITQSGTRRGFNAETGVELSGKEL